jgi:hypothetical protein
VIAGGTLYLVDNESLTPAVMNPVNVARLQLREDLTATQRYVANLYEGLLGRTADDGGVAFWAGLLDGGARRIDVALALEASPEYRLRVINEAYMQILNRQVDPSGLGTWAQYLAQGGTTTGMQAALFGSAEYFALQQNRNDNFVGSLYVHLFSRSADPAGEDAWLQALAAGASRADVALAFLRSPEETTLVVQDLYRRLLGREADPSGLNAFSQALQQGLAPEAVAAVIASSDEFFNQP